MEFLAFALILLAVPFVLPIALWVGHYRTRTRLSQLESLVDEQQHVIAQLTTVVGQLRAAGAQAAQPSASPQPAAPARPAWPADVPAAVPARVPPPPAVTEKPAIPPPPRVPPVSAPGAPPAPVAPLASPVPVEGATPAQPAAAGARAGAPPTPAPPGPPATPSQPALPVPPGPAAPLPPAPGIPARPPTERPSPVSTESVAERAAAVTPPAAPPRVPPPPRPAQPPPPPPPPVESSFDWESLVGVKLFSAIAGIALVFAAILFLRYSMQQGWLQPPVRVLIGIAVAVALLIVCELKAARNYPATANALDAAAIAILFATFFSAHALWNLIPAMLTFALLAAVTALAVMLSIRRESLFIAVLGLLGGFATPALLSTGENRPIPLFAYLALLNVGLAWVAYRQVWPVLTILTLVLTTLYQWVWVFRFLNANDLSLAMGIFAIFPVLSVGALLLGRRGRTRAGGAEDHAFEQTTIVAAALPLLFVAYLATVPAYGAHPGLLFGFLFLIDAGLLAISIALRRSTLHVVSALATLVVWAAWLTTSYDPGSRTLAIAFTFAFVALYLAAPAIARWFGKPLGERADGAILVAPALLFAYAVIAEIDPAAASPWPLFGPLAILVVSCAGAAYAYRQGSVFFIASFLAVAAQAVWSANYLTLEQLSSAVAIYALFGIISSAVPVLARRRGRTLEPDWGAALVLLASLGLLLFLSTGDIAPAALWALALLLAILNAGMFVESAASRVPLLSQVGSVLSWAILALWWRETAGVVGVLPSLAVLTGLALITLAGHAWAFHHVRADDRTDDHDQFGRGLYLGLVGHLFLLFVALNREWSLPPWPLFATLGVLALATSITSLTVRAPVLHAASVGAAGLVLIAWTATASVMPWTLTGVFASAVLSAYALAWIVVARRANEDGWARVGAAVALFSGEFTVMAASGAPGPAPFVAVLVMHVINVVVLLGLTLQSGWNYVSAGTLAVAWLAVLQWQFREGAIEQWNELLVLAAAYYATFTVYALVAGPRRREDREPWLVALAAAVMAFFAAREAFERGNLEWMIGVVPVVAGLVTAVLLRALLKLERTGERDMTRLALVAGVALGFVTVAIPLQLDHQWITIGWALEAAALAWLYQRVPHRGLLLACAVLSAAVFARLAVNPEVWNYEPRGTLRIFNWYLYTYLLAALSMFGSAWFLSRTNDRVASLPRLSHVLPAGAVILLFILLNIEIADYYATGPEIAFRFGVTVSQDLTYTIGWLTFGMLLLIAGIYLHNRPARVTAVMLIAVTTLKCFLYDLKSLEGLYRIGSFVGLAVALAVVSLLLQKYVLSKPKGTA